MESFEPYLSNLIAFVLEYWVWILGVWVGAGALSFALTFWYIRFRLTTTGIATAQEISSLEKLIPDSRFIEVDGARIHYVQAGEGTDVVLLHGIGASVFIWRFLFPILQVRHRVTAFDFPGFGQSCKEPGRDYGLDAQATLIAKALESMGIEKPFLVGSSMGGAIALWMAKLWPDRFLKIAVLGPATDPTFIPPQLKIFAPTAPWFRFGLHRDLMKLLLGYVVSRREFITDDVVERYLEPFKDKGLGLRAFVASTAVLSDRRLPGSLRDLAADVLVIWGARDFMVKRWSIKKLMRTLPKAALVEHPTGGHHIMEDEPAWIAKQLEIFFASLST
ncbi:MAG: alpha/beta hydrolase [Bdellovibrionota bacterium]